MGKRTLLGIVAVTGMLLTSACAVTVPRTALGLNDASAAQPPSSAVKSATELEDVLSRLRGPYGGVLTLVSAEDLQAAESQSALEVQHAKVFPEDCVSEPPETNAAVRRRLNVAGAAGEGTLHYGVRLLSGSESDLKRIGKDLLVLIPCSDVRMSVDQQEMMVRITRAAGPHLPQAESWKLTSTNLSSWSTDTALVQATVGTVRVEVAVSGRTGQADVVSLASRLAERTANLLRQG
ncbi:hypothetical protein [Arthrobacter sp. NPDC090010]|uniref:hypothetical protein n=1 Tax=Arthrobacter sp. NPDC090010 TaxID=3363942 RepID=UPI00381CE20C